MLRREYHVRVIYHELGSALSGRDVLCPDDKYHKCQTFIRDGDLPVTEIRKEFENLPDVYMVTLSGPYSNTSGD